MSSAKQDAEAPFFAVGSIFGGTGAAALPVLAQILHAEGIEKSRIGGALVTPYYALGEPSQSERQDGRLKPDSDVFLLNTAAALPTYTRGHSQYGSLYVVGDAESMASPRAVYSAGGATQRNDPHAVELFAALAALDFARCASEGRDTDTRMYYATAADKELSWGDLPLASDAREQLATFLVATNFFLHYFKAGRTPAQQQEMQKELASIPWLTQIGLDANFVRSRSEQLDLLGAYFADVWAYLDAATHNYVALRLVSFDVRTTETIPLPGDYARSGNQKSVSLPPVDNCLYGYAPRRRRRLFSLTKEADQLTSLAEMFNWYGQVRRPDARDLPGFLTYLREGTQRFMRDWYTTTSPTVR
jgi:hypothetical protein